MDAAYEVLNGLLGMGRDIVLRLCNLMGNVDQSLRMLFGMCQEPISWKNHPFFVESRVKNSNISMIFKIPDSYRGLTISSLSVIFSTSSWRTIFLDTKISKGVYQWTVRIAYAYDRYSSFCIGSAPCHRAWEYSTHQLGYFGDNFSGSASFWFWKNSDSSLGSSLYGVENRKKLKKNSIVVENNSLVSVEVNVKSEYLSFFLNKRKIPLAISNIICPVSEHVYLGISGDYGSFTSLSFRRLPTDTPSPVVCKVFECVYNHEDDWCNSDDDFYVGYNDD